MKFLKYCDHNLEVLRLLEGASFKSGVDMARRLGVSKTTVHQVIREFNTAGLRVDAVRGRGYRLRDAVVLLDQHEIQQQFLQFGGRSDCEIRILHHTASTNSYLRSCSEPSSVPRVVLAEAQTEGRGRRGKQWHSTPYSNILMSLAYALNKGMSQLGGLSLVAGLAVKNALEAFGIQGVALKWPNDLVVDGRKLGGVLIEIDGELSSSCLVVAGLGLNVRLDEDTKNEIPMPVTDLSRLVAREIDRNELAAHIINALIAAFRRFEKEGFASFKAEWERSHYFQGKTVRLDAPGVSVGGRVLGVDDAGALRLIADNGDLSLWSIGEISMRPVE